MTPNPSVKRTLKRAMPSAFSWPFLVPYAPAVLRRRLPWPFDLAARMGLGAPTYPFLKRRLGAIWGDWWKLRSAPK